MIRHPLRFILGLYPIVGWLIGLEVYNHYPQLYIGFTTMIFATWILYENIDEYLQFGGKNDIIEVNILGIFAMLSVFYLVYTNFPFLLIPPQIVPLFYLFFYIVYGIIINIH